MKERPIIFSGPMIRAILAGTKTQTRRIVKPQPTKTGVVVHDGFAIGTAVLGDGKFAMWKWPCVAPGDRLWVKETFCPRYFDDGKPGYRADWDPELRDKIPEPKWKSSLFMPHALSRLTLEVTVVRVERLQEISEEDARAEGVWTLHPPKDQVITECSKCNTQHASGIALFADLWDSINAKRAPWESNPWVWVVEFKRT